MSTYYSRAKWPRPRFRAALASDPNETRPRGLI